VNRDPDLVRAGILKPLIFDKPDEGFPPPPPPPPPPTSRLLSASLASSASLMSPLLQYLLTEREREVALVPLTADAADSGGSAAPLSSAAQDTGDGKDAIVDSTPPPPPQQQQQQQQPRPKPRRSRKGTGKKRRGSTDEPGTSEFADEGYQPPYDDDLLTSARFRSFVESLGAACIDKFDAFCRALTVATFIHYRTSWATLYPFLSTMTLLRDPSSSSSLSPSLSPSSSLSPSLSPSSSLSPSPSPPPPGVAAAAQPPPFGVQNFDFMDLMMALTHRQLAGFHAFWHTTCVTQMRRFQCQWKVNYAGLRRAILADEMRNLELMRATQPQQSSHSSSSLSSSSSSSSPQLSLQYVPHQALDADPSQSQFLGGVGQRSSSSSSSSSIPAGGGSDIAVKREYHESVLSAAASASAYSALADLTHRNIMLVSLPSLPSLPTVGNGQAEDDRDDNVLPGRPPLLS
jgi:hypothetical protein